MPITLEGSCHCGGVEFTVESHTPVPYQLCACSICRKCGGTGGSVNLGALNDTLNITKGKNLIKKYSAIKDRGKPSESKYHSERSFCSNCSTMLWVWDKSWPELIHPFASAIDTELPVPEEMICVRGDSKPAWIRWPEGPKKVFDGFNGNTGIDDYHKQNGLWIE